MVTTFGDLSSEENEIAALLRSIICLYGNDGLPISKVNEEYNVYVGHSVPYEKFGYQDLKSFVQTLPEIYLVKDMQNNEVLIEKSKKSAHIKDLIIKNKKPANQKRKTNYSNEYQATTFNSSPKKQRTSEREIVPLGSFFHTSINTVSMNHSDRFCQFEQLECMLPLFYKHQALGDDFFLDIADTKYGYYVPDNGPLECGLCSSGQTIALLTEKVRATRYLAPRVVVMIGFQDLLRDSSVNQMITDLRQLIKELKSRNTRVTLVTLIPTPKMPYNSLKLIKRMDIYNSAVLEYINDPELQCNVIDMQYIFDKEAQAFNRDYDRFKRVAKKDPYKVFSDYGRKTFLATLRRCLREFIEAGH